MVDIIHSEKGGLLLKEITDYLETYFPLSLQLSYDHCGLQIGNINEEIDSMLIALTLDSDVIQEAIDQDIHFILCHHPYFFHGIKTIDFNDYNGKLIQNCIRHNITVYALHTCLDIGIEESMNLWLAKAIGLTNIHKTIDDLVVEGELETDTVTLAKQLKEQFQLEGVRYTYPTTIHKVAIVGGSGAEFIDALVNQVDCLITGDTKYHEMQSAYENHLSVIDAGHFLEKIMVEKIKELLENIDIKVLASTQKDYYHYL